MASRMLTHEISILEASLCSALAEPTRLLILYALNKKSLNVTGISNELEIPQPNVSRHLKVLRESGLVNTTRQGSSIVYRLANRKVIEALDLLQCVLLASIQYQDSLIREFSTSGWQP